MQNQQKRHNRVKPAFINMNVKQDNDGHDVCERGYNGAKMRGKGDKYPF